MLLWKNGKKLNPVAENFWLQNVIKVRFRASKKQ